jgi:hypothetical protein
MALVTENVRVAVTGVVSKGVLATAAPTSAASALAVGFKDLGLIGEDGVSYTAAGAGDSTPIKAWQNGMTVRTIRSLTEDLPRWTFTLLETKLEVIEAYFGATVTQAVADGTWNIDTSVARVADSWVIDVVDAAELIRTYVPRGVVIEVGDLVYANAEPIGYEVTIEGERNSTLGYNAKSWATALKTP